MKATFVLGTLERDALKAGRPLTKQTLSLLEGTAATLDLDIDVLVVVEDPFMAGNNKSQISIDVLRKERPRILEAVHIHKPDFVVCFGPVATVCVFDHGNLKESDLIRTRHTPLGEDGPPVYVTYGMENTRRSPGLRQWVEMDIKAARDGLGGTEWGEYTVLLPGMPQWDKAPDFLNQTRKFPWAMAMDLETYPGLSQHDHNARIRMAQISVQEGRAWVIQATQKSEFPDWFRYLLADPNVIKVGSNIKFDVKWLRYFGYEVNNYEDTSTREHVLDGSNPLTDLKSLTHKYLDRLGNYAKGHTNLRKKYAVAKFKAEGIKTEGWELVGDDEQYDYAAADAEASIASWQGQVEPLEAFARPWELMRQLYPVIADMEYRGFCVDRPRNLQLTELHNAKLMALRTEITRDIGPINLNSSQQLAVELKRMIPDINLTLRNWKEVIGNAEDADITTCREVLAREAHKHPVLARILEYRSYFNRHNTFIKSVREKHLVGHHGAWYLHPHYRTDLVETYRLSSSNPPLMNVPRPDNDDPVLSVKTQFVSRFKGGKIVDCDMSQAEIRMVAWLSQDAALLEALQSGEDIHTSMAAKMLQKPTDKISDDERQRCKTQTFQILYGGGAGLLQRKLQEYGMRIDKKRAHGMIREYFATFGGVERYIKQAHEEVERDLQVDTAFGFQRRFSEPEDWKKGDGWLVRRQAFNMKIQCPAVCLTYCAMIWLHNELRERKMQSILVAHVHDNIVFDAHPDEIEAVMELGKYGMEIAAVEKAKEFDVNFDVPLVADVKVGDSWGSVQ